MKITSLCLQVFKYLSQSGPKFLLKIGLRVLTLLGLLKILTCPRSHKSGTETLHKPLDHISSSIAASQCSSVLTGAHKVHPEQQVKCTRTMINPHTNLLNHRLCLTLLPPTHHGDLKKKKSIILRMNN